MESIYNWKILRLLAKICSLGQSYYDFDLIEIRGTSAVATDGHLLARMKVLNEPIGTAEGQPVDVAYLDARMFREPVKPTDETLKIAGPEGRTKAQVTKTFKTRPDAEKGFPSLERSGGVAWHENKNLRAEAVTLPLNPALMRQACDLAVKAGWTSAKILIHPEGGGSVSSSYPVIVLNSAPAQGEEGDFIAIRAMRS